MTKSLLISQPSSRMVNVLNELAKYLVVKRVNKEVIDKLDRGETVEAYLYCTKSGQALSSRFKSIDGDGNGLYYTLFHDRRLPYMKILNGTIPVKVVIDGYDVITKDRMSISEINYVSRVLTNEKYLLEDTCLTKEQLTSYLGLKGGYALHISKVEILDEVMKLGDMYNFKNDVSCEYWLLHEQHFKDCNLYPKLKRPPQNMQSIWVK